MSTGRDGEASGNGPRLAALWIVTVALAGAMGTPVPLHAQNPDPPDGPPRIGLVLGGGSARGAAHVGVLQVLEELRIPVHVVVGTSMGAVVGGLWASGLSAAELQRELVAVDWADVFRDEVPRSAVSFRRKEEQRRLLLEPELGLTTGGPTLPSGLVAGHRLGLLLETLLLPVLPERDFDRLPIPFRATATDIVTGELVVMRRGRVGEAIRASMTVPAAFTPVERDGRLLVDGGLVENLPLSVAADLDVDVVIAVDVGSALRSPEDLRSLLGIASQVTRLMTRTNSDRALERVPPDLLIQPDLSGFSTTDFHRSAEIIERGEAAARDAAEALRRWALPPAEYDAWREQVDARRGDPPAPHFVRVEGPDSRMARRLRQRVHAPAGVPLDTAQLRADLDGIYGLGGFDRVGLELVNESGRQGLVVHAVPSALGPTTLRFGLALSDDFNGNGTYRLTAQILRLRLTRQGGELRLSAAGGEDRRIEAELYQPLAPASSFFVTAAAGHRRRTTRLSAGGNRGIHTSRRTSLGAGFGAHAGTWGRWTAGFLLDHVNAGPDDDEGTLEAFEGWEPAGVVRIEIDQLDDATFPRSGTIASAELVSVRERVGDAPSYDRFSADVARVGSRGRTTLILGLSGGTSLTGRIPLHDQFRLGGFLRISGLRTDALAGEEMILGRLILLRSVGPAEVGRIGVALEVGNAWSGEEAFSPGRLRPGATALAGIRTVLGAVHFGLGLAEGGEWAGHLFLGNLPF